LQQSEELYEAEARNLENKKDRFYLTFITDLDVKFLLVLQIIFVRGLKDVSVKNGGEEIK